MLLQQLEDNCDDSYLSNPLMADDDMLASAGALHLVVTK